MLRFGCSQVVIDRIDPLVNPGLAPSPHMHQVWFLSHAMKQDLLLTSMARWSEEMPSTSQCSLPTSQSSQTAPPAATQTTYV
jgi:hypothetical protein